MESHVILDTPPEQPHQVLVSSVDLDLRDEADDPGTEEILCLVRIPTEVHTIYTLANNGLCKMRHGSELGCGVM